MVYWHDNNHARRSSAGRNINSSNSGFAPPPPYDESYPPSSTNPSRVASQNIYPDHRSENEPLLASSYENRSNTRRNKGSIYSSLLKILFVIIIIILASILSFYIGHIEAQRGVRRAWMDLDYEKQSWARTQHQEVLQFERQKDIWIRKREDEERQLERDKEAWREERRQEQLQLERDKEAWKEERRQEQLQLEEDRRRIRQSRLALEQDRTAWMDERRRREEEEKHDTERRQRAGLAWVDPRPQETCLAYGKRNYQAKLKNLPKGVDSLKWCHETSIEILGTVYENPRMCSVEGEDIVGHWTVENDSYCHTIWTDFHDKGCTMPGSGIRRYEAKLDNFHSPDWPNGDVMCDTTPATFLGIHRKSPDYCLYYWGTYGHAGAWDVLDSSCN